MSANGWKNIRPLSASKATWTKKPGIASGSYDLAGVKVDEDYKRFYPYGELGSKVLGFTGSDNQGIIGLEVIYEEVSGRKRKVPF